MLGKLLTTLTVLAITAGTAYADNGWETTIFVASARAENKLALGMKNDARDGIDKGYDVPALIFGKPELQAYLELEGGSYWRVVKAACDGNPCDKTWDLFIEAAPGDKVVRLRWDPKDFPPDMTASLTDTAAGTRIDMKSRAQYSYKNDGKRRFTIEVKSR